MRILGIVIINSTAFSLLSNSNSKIDGKQITFGAVDFQPHPTTLALIFASLDQEMALMIRSLNFRVGSLGSVCLSDPINPGPSAGKTASAARSESLVGSSSEVNSPVSFKPTENMKNTVDKIDEIMEKLDLGEASGYSEKYFDENFDNILIKDLITRSSGVSDSSENMWIPEGKHTSSIHQMYVIISEAAEDDDGGNNLVIN
jgi:hypothetical protein